MYAMLSASTQGYDHIRRNAPCEDAGAVTADDTRRIFAVSDGHGDPNCPRAAFGARVACDAALSELSGFCDALRENDWEARLLEPGKDRDRLVRQLVVSVMAKWIRTVNADLEESPLTEAERAACDRYLERYDRGERLEHIYGATLIAGLMTDRYLLLLQQGDGRCVVFHADGSADEPVPWDDRCFANVTTSLCSPDAVESFRYAVVDLEADPIVACMLASDGVEDSFPSMELMIAYCRELLAYAAEHGVEALNAHLDETLPDFSRTGSGDDVTLCGVIDPERAAAFNEVYERQNAVVRQQGVVADLEARMDSMRGMGKLDALKARYEDARQRAEQARDDLTAAQGALDAYSDDLMKLEEAEAREPETVLAITRVIKSFIPDFRREALQRRVEDMTRARDEAQTRLEDARQALEVREAEYDAYRQKWEDLESRLNEAREALEALKGEETDAS